MTTLERLVKACEFAADAVGTVRTTKVDGQEMYAIDSDEVAAAVERHYGTCGHEKVLHLMSYMAKFHAEDSCEMCLLLSMAHAASHIFQETASLTSNGNKGEVVH